jgi:hypothetical protein
MTWWAFAFQVSTGAVVAGSDRISIPLERLPDAPSRLSTDTAFTVAVPVDAYAGVAHLTPYLIPWKYGLGLAWDREIVQAGPIAGRVTYDPDSETWSVPCASMGALLTRKRLLNHGGVVTYTGPSLAHLARQAVAASLARTGGGLPIDLPTEASLTPPGSGPTDHTRTYDADKPIMVGRAVEQLGEALNGPEWLYRPYFSSTSSLTAARWELLLGLPYLGSPGVTHTWTTGPAGVLVSAEPGTEGDRVADNYYVPGQPGAGFVLGKSLSSALTESGYPLLDDVDSSHTSVTSQATADGYAAANRSRWTAGARSLDVLVRRDKVLGTVRLGDLVRIPVTGYIGLPDTTYTARLVGLSVVDEQTLSAEVQVLTDTAAAYPAVGRRMDGAHDDVRELARVLDEQTRTVT